MISPFLTSDEQSAVRDSVGQLKNISYLDSDVAVQTLLLSLLKNLREDKSAIIVVPAGQECEQISDLFTDAGIIDLVIKCDPNHILVDEDYNIIASKLIKKAEIRQTDEIAEIKYTLKNQSVLSYYAMLQKKVIEGQTWKEVLGKYLKRDKDDRIFILHSSLDLSNFQFDIGEYNLLQHALLEALKIYKRSFEIEHFKASDSGIQADINLIDNIETVTYALFTLKEVGQQIRERYYSCLAELENDQLRKEKEWVSETVYALKVLDFRTKRYISNRDLKAKKKSVFNPFSKEEHKELTEKSDIKEATRLMVLSLQEKKIVQACSIPESLEDFSELFSFLKKELLSFELKIGERIHADLRASNKLNRNETKLDELESDLQQLLLRINELNIFRKNLELNTLSFRKQAEYISNLVYKMDNLMLRLEQNKSYYQWLSFLDEQDSRSHQLLQVLTQFEPIEWQDIFETWYNFEVLRRNLSLGKAIALKDLTDCEDSFEQWQAMEINKMVLEKQSKIKGSIEMLKKQHPDFFASLMKKKKNAPSLTWKQLLKEASAFFSAVFPVLIIQSDNFKNQIPDSYTELYYFNYTDVNPEILQHFNTVHSYIPEESTRGVKVDFALKLANMQDIQPIVQVTMTERLSLVKKLTTNILSFGSIPVMYHLRNASIISFCSIYFNDVLIDRFYDFGIKEAMLDNSVSDTLIATLLDVNKMIFVFTEDYIINSEKSDSYLYQRIVVDQIQQAGCNVINVDSMELLEKGISVMEEAFNEIRLINNFHLDKKNQRLIEFN